MQVNLHTDFDLAWRNRTQEHRQHLADAGITFQAMLRAGDLGVERINASGRLYMPSPDGFPAVILAVWSPAAPSIYRAVDDPEIHDLIALRTDEPRRWWCRLGESSLILGEDLYLAAIETGAPVTQDRTQAPMAICCQSVLGAATQAVQGHANVKLPTDHVRPVSEYFITVAATGERKSACDREALWPIRKREKRLQELYDEDRDRWQNDQDAWESQRRQILNNKKDYPDRIVKKSALDDLGPAPTAPLTPMLTCTEPTFEGLAKLYAIGQPGLGVFSAEGGQFIGGHGMNEENKLRTATALSALWDGEAIKRVRAGDGATTMPGRRLCLHLMVQPEVASLLLTDRVLADPTPHPRPLEHVRRPFPYGFGLRTLHLKRNPVCLAL